MTLAVLSQPAGPNAGHRRPVPDGAWSAAEGKPLADGATGLDRLLFMPLTPVIVPAPAWRPETPAIPLTALPALAAAVFAGLGVIADPVAAIIRDTAWGDGTATARAGALLWPHAARILDAATNMAGRPAEWATTGLPAGLYPMLASGAAAILREAPAISLLTRAEAAGAAFPEDALSAILTATAGRGPAAWALVIQVLLARLPHPDALLRLAASARGGGGGPALRAATERGIAALLDRSARQGGAHGPVGHLKLCDAGMETRRLASLLDGLAGESAGPDRRRHAEILRARLDSSCQARFAAGLEEELVAPLRELHSHSAAPTPAPLARLEAAARALRRLETEARRVGSAVPYNRMLYQASALLKAMPDDGKLALVDRVRLVEILTGPEEALALLASRAR